MTIHCLRQPIIADAVEAIDQFQSLVALVIIRSEGDIGRKWDEGLIAWLGDVISIILPVRDQCYRTRGRESFLSRIGSLFEPGCIRFDRHPLRSIEGDCPR